MDNLKNQVAKLLDELELKYNINEKKHRFELDETSDNAAVSINLYYDEECNGLYNLSCLTFNLPQERTTALLHKINKIHNGYSSIGHFYLNTNNNRIGLQSVIHVPETGIDKDVFIYFLSEPIQILDENYDEIMKVAFGPDNIAKHAINKTAEDGMTKTNDNEHMDKEEK